MAHEGPTTDAGGEPRYRDAPRPGDLAALRRLVAAAGVFHPQEREIALELLEERLLNGTDSGYFFVFAEAGKELVGYACWGPVPLTRSSYDLYWIAVHAGWQGRGIGRALLALTEKAVAGRGGGRLYIETSARDVYRRPRDFYLRAGYAEVARLEHFYAEDDPKLIYCKAIAPA